MKTPKGFFSITIQTKPYLKKYLESLYGAPLMFTTENSFGIIVDALLTRPAEDHHSATEIKQRFDKYDTPLEFYMPVRNLFKRKGFAITERQTISLNKFFEKQFCEQLLTWCEMGVIYNVEFKKNIQEFCWRHKILIGEESDDDITFDSLKQKEYRSRKKKEEKSKQPAPPIVLSKIEYF
jgi:hypothetical protein